MNETKTCKRCQRPYVRPFNVNVDFPEIGAAIDWEGCADCIHVIRRQMVDFMLRATEPPRRIKRKLQDARWRAERHLS